MLASRVDLKGEDARACLVAAARLRPPIVAPVSARLSSFVRRSRLPPAKGPADEGVKTLLLADFARQAGIVPPPARVTWWRKKLSGPFAADQLQAWAEALALEELVLLAPQRFVSDGPSHLEGAALLQALRRR